MWSSTRSLYEVRHLFEHMLDRLELKCTKVFYAKGQGMIDLDVLDRYIGLAMACNRILWRSAIVRRYLRSIELVFLLFDRSRVSAEIDPPSFAHSRNESCIRVGYSPQGSSLLRTDALTGVLQNERATGRPIIVGTRDVAWIRFCVVRHLCANF